jgi:PAS domain S-box-containing protein
MHKTKLFKTEFKQLKFDDINEAFIENSPTFCVAINEDGRIVKMNKAMLDTLGYKREEVTGRDYISMFIPERDRDLLAEIFKRHIKMRESTINENNIIAKDGREFIVEWHAGPVIYDEGEYAYHLGVGINITERKRMENALRESEHNLRVISAQLMAAEEKERSRISRELHDELGQALSILKLDVGSIMRKLQPDQGILQRECKKIRDYIDDVIENVRRLARDLSPAIIEDLGLSIAIRELIDSVSKYYRVESSLQCEEIDNFFSPENKIAIYRIFQESLNNIVKHAHATHIATFIEKQEDHVIFKIKDNGIGFNIQETGLSMRKKRGLGLATISERVKMLGGSFDVKSEKGKGTQVTYIIPVKKEVSEIGNL